MFYCILNFLFGSNAHGIDRTALWTGVTALAALIAVLVAWFQLGKTAKTTQADFAKRFVDSFFTEDTRTLFAFLMNSALEFKVLIINAEDGTEIDNLPYFRIKPDIANQLKGLVDARPGKTGYSAFEIDDLILGPLDDVGWYQGRDLIDLETVREMFGYYIDECNRNEVIQGYLDHGCNKEKYENFKRLAKVIGETPRK